MPNDHLFETVADYLRTELFPDISPQSQHVFLGLYRLIVQGSPVTLSDLSVALVINRSTLRKVLGKVDPSCLQYDEKDSIIAFAGLNQAPAPHRFLFDGIELYTWCAFDSLFLPHLLCGGAQVAQVSSTCSVTNATLQLTVTPQGPKNIDRATTVMSFVMPSPDQHCGNLRRAFCNHVNFLASPEAASIWKERHPDTAILSVKQVFELGRMRNQVCFKDVLSTSTGQNAPSVSDSQTSLNP